ncbi:MAG: tRNA (uridine(34)/cytosine(34)/5-carboxymethylaminomethyluridine(34)-2'-O)-methyltransferase TrmL [Gammaproteobacteria bacterium]|nr:tRNA (uridine(34)/cytosine(34)/5-carboxymethylaminomethyluridine(34)-2'-O)-methyltransferase TrmL [Gammaproteobacteria bacterium]
MFHCVLYQPEIPGNTGNIIRLCANMGAQLHLIHPLGFVLEDKKLKRAGLDYHEWVNIQEYQSLEAFMAKIDPTRLFAGSTRASHNYTENTYLPGDSFLFGPETRGLPQALLEQLPKRQVIRIPMQPDRRSLNLSNAAAVVLYEAWRQINFQMTNDK